MPRLLILSLLLPVLTACSSAPKLPEACDLKPESGQCRASLMRYYLDDRTGTCKGFIWGGCNGVVPFETLESCHAQCMPGKPLPPMPVVKNPVPPATP